MLHAFILSFRTHFRTTNEYSEWFTMAVFVGEDAEKTKKAATDKADELSKTNPGNGYKVDMVPIVETIDFSVIRVTDGDQAILNRVADLVNKDAQ